MPAGTRSRFSLTRVLVLSLLTLVALLVAAWFGGRMVLERSLMPTEGRVELPVLSGDVEISFDARGIPRIRATSDRDALAALGWLHAGERLFQMELLRAVARGELAEIVGAAGLESDRLHRNYGFARRIEQEPPDLSGEVRGLLQAYVDGINARIGTGEQPLPPSFVLLGRTPRPWSVDDVLMLAYYQTWYPTTLVQRLAEAWREAARAHGGTASDWLEKLPAWGVPSVPAQRITDASNTWVVSPSQSASGAALHASDPHLDYTMAPGLWYAAGIHSDETLNVVGVTAPGLPFVGMGHNGRIAFAFTVAPVDLYEVYRFERVPGDDGLLIGPEGRFPIIERTELIRVRDREQPIEHTVSTTRYGLVTETDAAKVEVLRWAGFELPIARLIESGLAINRAEDFAGFRTAASDMGALSVNWSYSDAEGNIGYVQSTPIPLRRHEVFYATIDGSDPLNHWAGFVPPEERPYAFNPEQGWIANANNHAAIDAPYPMPGFYKHLRMRRAVDWLSDDRDFTPTDMRAMQLDRTSERAVAFKNRLAEIAEKTGRTPLAAQLRAWDGVMRADSEMAGVFALWWQFLPRHLFENSELADWRFGRTLLDDWMMQPPAAFELSAIDLDEAAGRALDDVLRLGIPPLGAVQTLTIAHPLAQAGLLDRWLNLTRGPLPIGGGPGSLNVTYHAFDDQRARLTARAGASMRFVLDWADPDAFTLNLTLGQSGHPLSPHFDDQLGDFLTGTPWTVPFSQSAVDAQAVSTLRLVAD